MRIPAIAAWPLFALAFAACAGGCSRKNPPDVGGESTPEQQKPAPHPGEGPWLTVEKTGGIAGFRFTLDIAGNGTWTARDLSRGTAQQGRFATDTLDSLRDELSAISEPQWADFPSGVADDFFYRVTLHQGGRERTMKGGGQALPRKWRLVIDILERPFVSLMTAAP